MKLKRTSFPVALSVLVVAVAVAAAFAADSPTGPAERRAHLSSASELGIFAGTFAPTSAQRATLDALQAWAQRAPAESILVTADLRRARPASIPGSNESVWLAPAADGGACAFTPQPGTGGERFGASCSTLEDLNENGIVAATYGDAKQDSVVITVVQPDGVSDPVIVNANGARKVAFRSNVAVTTAHYGDAVEVSGLRLDIRPPQTMPLP